MGSLYCIQISHLGGQLDCSFPIIHNDTIMRHSQTLTYFVVLLASVLYQCLEVELLSQKINLHVILLVIATETSTEWWDH